MQEPTDVWRRKRRANRAVLAGVAEMVVTMVLSAQHTGPLLLTTLGWLTGLALVVYGVHVGWMVFYDRDPRARPAEAAGRVRPDPRPPYCGHGQPS